MWIDETERDWRLTSDGWKQETENWDGGETDQYDLPMEMQHTYRGRANGIQTRTQRVNVSRKRLEHMNNEIRNSNTYRGDEGHENLIR